MAARCAALAEPLGAVEAERRVFEQALQRGEIEVEAARRLYEDFLDAFEPGRRRTAGVYYTPPELAAAQVRLVDDALRTRLGCAAGLGDQRVLIVDPCAGSGAYPLAVIAHVGTIEVRQRLRCFEPAPGAAALGRARGLPIDERDALDASIDFDAPIVICLGNPPYHRGARGARAQSLLDGLVTGGRGVHRKNLYNDYVYFWCWALRVVFAARAGAGVVCFVTAASYLRGAAFDGLRQKLRQVLDELWIIDLEGDPLAARKSDNVFPIRTPVAVALGLRRDGLKTSATPKVSYASLGSSGPDKLAALESLERLDNLAWRTADTDTFLPSNGGSYARWPKLTELFPWQLSGAQLKRTWPIAPTPEVLRQRWQHLLELPPEARAAAFGPTRDRDIDRAPPDLLDPAKRLPPLRELPVDAACVEPVPYAYRSFDRQWVLPDARLGDFMRPALWRIAGPRQLFLTSMLTNVLGAGPAVVATRLVPDLDHFRGSFGARAVVPLWCDAAGLRPNVDGAWLARLSDFCGFQISPEALMAYCYGLLATRSYVARFAEQLRIPAPRVPITLSAELFRQAVGQGERLLALHTYRQVTRGDARCLTPVGREYPTRFRYEAASGVLWVQDGAFGPIPEDVWSYSVSGLQVVRSWLRRRISPSRAKSRMDAIRPGTWTAELTSELLELLWLVEATLALEPALDALLDAIVSGRVWQTSLPRCQQPLDGLGSERSREDVALSLVTPELLELSPL